MLLKVLKSKLHRATVTDTRLHYPGSLAVDPDFLEAAGILAYESVVIADLENGSRLETYVVPADRGSKDIIVLGAAARLITKGHLVIVMNFAFCTPEEAAALKPRVVVFGENNEITKMPS